MQGWLLRQREIRQEACRGTLLAGFLADAEANPAIESLKKAAPFLWLEQLKAGAVILVWSLAASYVLYKVVDKLIGCRPGGIR